MPPIFSTRAQTQHPCRQIQLERDPDGRITSFFQIYSTVSVVMQVKRVNTHRNMNPRHGRGLRWLLRLLHLIGREGSRYGLPSLEETHNARFLCTCRPLSTTGRILDRMARFSLGIFLTLSYGINNGAN
jgi:hypothetical protein